MGKNYHQIQAKERLKIYELLLDGYAIEDIAKILKYHKATIYRELNRNSSKFGYRPDWAEQQYCLRRRQKPTKLSKNDNLKNFIIQKLKSGWSPDAIAGRLKSQTNQCIISHETIYRFIYSPEGIKNKLYRYLQKKRRFRYPRIKRRRKTITTLRKKSIHDRSETVNQRKTFGHWEGDLVLFKHTKTNLFTLRERKSRYIIAIKNQCRKAKSTTRSLLNYMKDKFDTTVKTLTLDNDPAFSMHKDISTEMNAKVYFCDPYKSYQKGGIENANRRIRTQLPKGTKIENWEQKEIDKVIEKLNDIPMRCLGYQTPSEAFLKAFGERDFLMGCRA